MSMSTSKTPDMYKDKRSKRVRDLLKNAKVRVILVVLLVAGTVILSVLKFSTHQSAHNSQQQISKKPVSKQSVQNGEREDIDASLDARVVSTIWKETKGPANQASFQHPDGHVDKISDRKVVSRGQKKITATTKAFPIILPTPVAKPTAVDPNKSKVVILNQNKHDGSIRVVDRIDSTEK